MASKKATKKPKGRARQSKKKATRARPSRRKTVKKVIIPLTERERKQIPAQRRLAKQEIKRLQTLRVSPPKPRAYPLKIAMGLKADPKSAEKSPTLSRNRNVIMSHYHRIEHAGYAQVTAGIIGDNIRKKTRHAPTQLIIRVKSEGGQKELVSEALEFHKRAMGQEGYAGRMRVVRNDGGSIDGELRLETKGKFRRALLALGDIMSWPKKV